MSFDEELNKIINKINIQVSVVGPGLEDYVRFHDYVFADMRLKKEENTKTINNGKEKN